MVCKCLVIDYCHLSITLNVLFLSPTRPHPPPGWWEQSCASSSSLVFSLGKLKVQELNPGLSTPQISRKALESHKQLLSRSHCQTDETPGRGGREGSDGVERQPSAPGPPKSAEVPDARVSTVPSCRTGRCKESCSGLGKQRQWLHNLTMVIHVGLSPRFLLNVLENRCPPPVKFGLGGGMPRVCVCWL